MYNFFLYFPLENSVSVLNASGTIAERFIGTIFQPQPGRYSSENFPHPISQNLGGGLPYQNSPVATQFSVFQKNNILLQFTKLIK